MGSEWFLTQNIDSALNIDSPLIFGSKITVDDCRFNSTWINKTLIKTTHWNRWRNVHVMGLFFQKSKICPVYLYLLTGQSWPFQYGGDVSVSQQWAKQSMRHLWIYVFLWQSLLVRWGITMPFALALVEPYVAVFSKTCTFFETHRRKISCLNRGSFLAV
jgi:hypothetical protein